MKRNVFVLVATLGVIGGCAAPEPADRPRLPDAMGATSGTSGSGSVGFASDSMAAEVEYWKLDAKQDG